MSFNPDTKKQSQKVIFPTKLNEPNHPSSNFKNAVVIQSTTHQHLACLQYVSHLLDLIMIMATSYMTNHRIAHFIRT